MAGRLTDFRDGVFDAERGESCCFVNYPGKWHMQIATEAEDDNAVFFHQDCRIYKQGKLVEVSGKAVPDIQFKQWTSTVYGYVNCLDSTECKNVTVTMADHEHHAGAKPFSVYRVS